MLFQRLPVKLYGGCGHGSVATKTLSDYLVKKVRKILINFNLANIMIFS